MSAQEKGIRTALTMGAAMALILDIYLYIGL